MELGGAFAAAVTGMAVLGLDGRFRRVNPALCRMLARPQEELAGRRPVEFTHPDDRATSVAVLERLVSGRAVTDQVRKRYVRPDGTVVHVVRTTTLLRDGEGAPRGLFTQVVDVSGVVEAHDALRQSEKRFRALVAHASELQVVVDGAGSISYASPASLSLLGLTPTELVGRSAFEFIHPDDLDRAAATFSGHLASTGRPARAAGYRLRHRDGAWRHVEVITTSLVEDPDVGALVVNVRDVTDHHRYEEALAARAAQQDAVAALSGLALGGGPLDGLFGAAVEAVARVLGVEQCVVLRSGGTGRLAAVARFGPPVDASRIGSDGGLPGPLGALALSRGETVVWEGEGGDLGDARSGDAGSGDAGPAHAPPPGPEPAGVGNGTGDPDMTTDLRSGAAAVIAGADGPWGAVAACSTEPGAFSLDHVSFLEACANVLSAAVARRRTEDELRRRALHDGLTGLPNRTLLLDRLRAALRRLSRNPGNLTVLLIDTDDFKLINDTLGHAAGDVVVTTVAERIGAVLRRGDTVARLGGDEFVVLCEETDIRTARAVAARIRRSVSEPIDLEGRSVVVTASIGIAATSDADITPGDLLARADTAMYAAKHSGKDRSALFHVRMRRDVTDRLDTAAGLRTALAEDQLRLYYQPVVRTSTRTVIGAEALVRWDHPVDGVVGPDRFIGHAEKTGLIVPVGAWVVETACAQAAAWKDTGVGGHVSINVSGRQLTGSDLVGTVRRALESTGADPGRIYLEVTESAVMGDLRKAGRAIERLRALGVHVGMDDFGTGYSSLSNLADLPFEFVKIDRSFVANFDRDRRAAALLETIATLCRALRLRAIAEGVETEEQLERVRELGIPFLQGFLFGRPVPAAAFPVPAGRPVPVPATVPTVAPAQPVGAGR